MHPQTAGPPGIARLALPGNLDFRVRPPPSVRQRRGKWALYEAWVQIQTGEVDSALVYGFGKASSAKDVFEVMALQNDPYYVTPLWPSMVDLAALQARAYCASSSPTAW